MRKEERINVVEGRQSVATGKAQGSTLDSITFTRGIRGIRGIRGTRGIRGIRGTMDG